MGRPTQMLLSDTNKLDIISSSKEDVKYACENFHYLKKIPAGMIAAHSVYEEGQFIGTIVYAGGAIT